MQTAVLRVNLTAAVKGHNYKTLYQNDNCDSIVGTSPIRVVSESRTQFNQRAAGFLKRSELFTGAIRLNSSFFFHRTQTFVRRKFKRSALSGRTIPMDNFNLVNANSSHGVDLEAKLLHRTVNLRHSLFNINNTGCHVSPRITFTSCKIQPVSAIRPISSLRRLIKR